MDWKDEVRRLSEDASGRKYDIKMNDLDRMRECAERIRDWVGASLRQEGVFLGGPGNGRRLGRRRGDSQHL